MTETHSDPSQTVSEKAVVEESQAATPAQSAPTEPTATDTQSTTPKLEEEPHGAEVTGSAEAAQSAQADESSVDPSQAAPAAAPEAASPAEDGSDAASPAVERADVGSAAAEESGASGEAGPDAEAASDAGADTKKRRRRRKKKKTGEAGAAEGKPAHAAHAPFLNRFSGTGGRKHAFSVGEVIAGRVESVEDGTIVVDLFGKAKAVADLHEPRDIPIVVDAAPKTELEPVSAVASDASAQTVSTEAAPAASIASEDAPAAAAAEAAAVAEERAAEPTVSTEALTIVAPDTAVPAQAVPVKPTPAEAVTAVGTEVAAMVDPNVETLAGADAPAAEASSQEAGAHPEDAEGPDHWAFPESAGRESEPPPPPGEDLSEADLSLLDPLPELEPPALGGIFRGRIGSVAESGHIAIVNRIVDKAAVRKALRAAREKRQRVVGVVYGYNRGGFDVMVAGVRAFCPASGMSLTPIENPEEFIGKKWEFSLPQDKGGKRSIIVSRRNILEKEARKRARERMSELELGMKLKGKVLDIRDYGVVVDLGDGLDGLVHLSEISWNRGARPADVVKVGDEVEVEVVKLQPASRKDRFGRVSLSMRKCLPDPWDAAQDILRPGTPVHGKIVRTTDFGAFIELREGIEGLLHISELSSGHKELAHAKQAVTEGDEIDVVVERVDKEQRRISLSRLSEADAQAVAAGELDLSKAPRSLKAGSHIAVVVKRVDHQGVQVQVEGVLGRRGRGFIPNRELQDQHGERRKGPAQGDVIDVKVLGIDRDGSLRCSVRARLLDEERRAVRDYRKESAKQGLGTFGDLLKAKLGGDSSE
jgi:small subunit ribosomal protein S1